MGFSASRVASGGQVALIRLKPSARKLQRDANDEQIEAGPRVKNREVTECCAHRSIRVSYNHPRNVGRRPIRIFFVVPEFVEDAFKETAYFELNQPRYVKEQARRRHPFGGL